MERHLASVLPRARSPRVLSVPRYGRGVLSRWLGGFAALVVTLVTGALVILDVTDDGLRRWWSKRSPWAATAKTPGQTSHPAARLDDAVQRLRTASTPLLQVLDAETRLVILGDQSG